MNIDATYPQPPSAVPAVPWGIRDIVFAILFAAAGIILLNVLALGATIILGLPLRENRSALMFVVVIQDLIIISAGWLFGAAKYRVSWDSFGLRAYSVSAGCALSALLLFASFILRAIYIAIISLLGISIEPQDMLMRLDTRGPAFVLSFVVVAVIAPIAEELFFRGFLYAGLRRRMGVVGAMIASSILFTALHASLGFFIPILFLGLFLAWLYENTGSLYPSIILHAANNGIALVALYFIQSSGLLPT